MSRPPSQISSKAINEACDRDGVSRGDIAAATLGLAGVRRADLKRSVRESFIKRIGIRNVEVVTDAEIALFATTLGKPGLVVIAGTGSVCLGKNEKGEMAISGGWGPLAGDEGGGVGIAQQALHTIAKASDGRGVPTMLSQRASEYFRASGPENLIVAIYSPQVDNSRIAGFARLVVETAQEGDEIAIEILKDAGYELGLAACAVIEKLNSPITKSRSAVSAASSTPANCSPNPMLEKVRKCAPKALPHRTRDAPRPRRRPYGFQSSLQRTSTLVAFRIWDLVFWIGPTERIADPGLQDSNQPGVANPKSKSQIPNPKSCAVCILLQLIPDSICVSIRNVSRRVSARR